MPFRFLHTADLHLDSPLRSLAARDEALAGLVGAATREALVRIVDLAIAEGVAAVLVAGDLWDGSQTSVKTARFLAGELGRLHDAGIRAILIRGNHDAMSRITRELSLPPSAHLFGGRAGTVRLDGAADGRDVAIHGLSFAEPAAPESLLPRDPAPVPGAINVGLLHTSLGGSAGHDPYAPCTPADLAAAGYDYWALGHIHQRRVVRAAGPAIVMPGCPQGRDMGEAGPKSVTLAAIAGDGTVTLAERRVAVAAFARVPVPLGAVADWAELLAATGDALAAARRDAAADILIARLVLSGRTPLAFRIRREADLLLEEARARAEALGATHVEGVGTEAVTEEAGAAAGGPLPDLVRLVREAVIPDPAFASEAGRIAEELRQALPGEARGFLGTDEAGVRAALDALVREGADAVLAALAPDAEG